MGNGGAEERGGGDGGGRPRLAGFRGEGPVVAGKGRRRQRGVVGVETVFGLEVVTRLQSCCLFIIFFFPFVFLLFSFSFFVPVRP
jgi:hypothetical protein